MTELHRPEHVSAFPITHTGPGHKYGDPGYCEGCWWEQVGRWEEPQYRDQHVVNCPGCES